MKNENNKQTTPEPTSRHAETLVLPLMKTVDDAYELCRLEQDNFYMSVFMIQCWLGHATLSVTAEYAEKKAPRTRALQTGQTWRAFTETLGSAFTVGADHRADRKAPGGLPEKEPTPQRTVPTDSIDVSGAANVEPITPNDLDKEQLCHLIAAVFRFTEYEDPYAYIVREAVAGYLFEHRPLSQAGYTKQLLENPVPIFLRLCDWFDAVLHLQNHILWHKTPVSFDPDPDKRELATLGFLQRNLSLATPVQRAHWQWHYGEAAERFAGSPKLRAVADGFSSDATRVWNYPDVDISIISVWPMVKRHNWTYADLLKTIRPKLKRPDAYPCDREQTFATYCTNVLGLRKTRKGRSSQGELAGAEVAQRLLGINK